MANRRCDCENSTCHPKANCQNVGTVKTIYSTICADCAVQMPAKYLVGPSCEHCGSTRDETKDTAFTLSIADPFCCDDSSWPLMVKAWNAACDEADGGAL